MLDLTKTEALLEDENGKNIEKEYQELEIDRDPFLERARVSSKYTINYLILPEGSDGNTDLIDLYQSIGATGTNNLANKLLMVLLPPNKLFFNIELKTEAKVKIKEEDTILNIQKVLRSQEQEILNNINNSSIRNVLFNSILNLIVSGNALIYINEDNQVKNFTLEEFGAERDSYGNILKIITKEIISYQALDSDIREIIDSNEYDIQTSVTSQKYNSNSREYDLYTIVYLEDDKFKSFQSIGSFKIENTEKTFKKDELPYIPLRWSVVRNENYGRSSVDLIIGDLKTLEEGNAVIVKSASIMSDIKFFVKPNSGINVNKVRNSQSGSYHAGDVNAVGVAQVNKTYDLQILNSVLQETEKRVGKHFLLVDGVQRDAERVTAEEIKTLANELENSLGGVYSLLSEELQLPLIKIFIRNLERNKLIEKTPVDLTDIKIRTGVDALGRNNEIVKLNTFLQQISVFGESAIAQINVKEYIRLIGDNLGLDMTMLVKTDDQVSQEQQASQEQRMIEESTPGVVQEVVKGSINNEIEKEKV